MGAYANGNAISLGWSDVHVLVRLKYAYYIIDAMALVLYGFGLEGYLIAYHAGVCTFFSMSLQLGIRCFT